MADTLDRAVEASEIVDALKSFGITQVDVAEVTQVSDRAVRGWRTGDIRPDRYDRLAQLRDLVLLLSDSLTPRGVGQWLHAKNRLLDGERPIDLLAEKRHEEVRGAAEAFIDGSYV
jgi:transcriptional regulator with XRE-family HTH domain